MSIDRQRQRRLPFPFKPNWRVGAYAKVLCSFHFILAVCLFAVVVICFACVTALTRVCVVCVCDKDQHINYVYSAAQLYHGGAKQICK